MQKCLTFVFNASLYFNINVQRNIVSTPISIALSAIGAIACFHSLFIGTAALVVPVCTTVSQWRGNLCSDILPCKDGSLPLWWMWSSNSYSILLLTDLWLWPDESWAHAQPCLMPWWLQAEVWDVLTGLDLREKPETVVRNNGAGAAPLGNTHKYVHRMAHHSDNKPAHAASVWDVTVSDIKPGSRRWWVRLVAAPLQRNLDFIRCTSVIGLMETDCRLDEEHSKNVVIIIIICRPCMSEVWIKRRVSSHVSPDPLPLWVAACL